LQKVQNLSIIKLITNNGFNMTEEKTGGFASKFQKADLTPKKSKIDSIISARKPDEENQRPAEEGGKFFDTLVNTRKDLCFKIVGRDSTGEIAWYFVLIDKDKKEKFLKHKAGDKYNIEDYGKIIESGYGEEVPADIQQTLGEKYGFDNF
jgi:hypothetical protein